MDHGKFDSLNISIWDLPICIISNLPYVAAIIGLLYPFFDNKLGEPHTYRREWSSVMRCVAFFVGINHASAVSFTNQLKDGFNLECIY